MEVAYFNKRLHKQKVLFLCYIPVDSPPPAPNYGFHYKCRNCMGVTAQLSYIMFGASDVICILTWLFFLNYSSSLILWLVLLTWFVVPH